MSEENVAAFRRGMEAYNRRDIDAFLEIFDPAAEIHPLDLAMFGREATVHRGHEGIRKFIREVDEVLPEIQVEILEVRDLGEQVVGGGRIHGRGRASGVEVESPIGWVIEFKRGLIIRQRDYPDLEQALEAAGPSE